MELNHSTETCLIDDEIDVGQEWQPWKIIPKNWTDEISIPPYELRLVRRQELREIEDVTGNNFFRYF